MRIFRAPLPFRASRIFAWCWLCAGVAAAQVPSLPGRTPILDAHNCYPYVGRWADRIDRALSTGFPVAIEQDLAWFADPGTGRGRSIVAHGKPYSGAEPGVREYFFERVRPIIERALREGNRGGWPILILHFDFKDNEPAHLREIWKLLGEYEGWLSTAERTADPLKVSPVDVKPLLVLTEDSDVQERVFWGDVPVGGRLRVFGAAKVNESYLEGLSRPERLDARVRAAPDQMVSQPPTNYRRWWNNSWYAVERGGAPGAGEWTAASGQRLRSLVDYAHRLGYWIRFYTLDGFAPEEDRGWGKDYNFGSRQAVLQRWEAAVKAGVDLIATDQYEELRRLLPRK